MDINQKLIHLLENIMNSRKGYCGNHYVYTPQLEADDINKLHAKLVASQSINAQDTQSPVGLLQPCQRCGRTDDWVCKCCL